MGLIDRTRRAWKDLRAENEYVDGRPETRIKELQTVLAHLTPEQRAQRVEHVKNYATYYYEGHHRENVPASTSRDIAKLERESQRLDRVDKAREVLMKYGGAPTIEHLDRALERSVHQRANLYNTQTSQQQERTWTDLHPKQERAHQNTHVNANQNSQAQGLGIA
jgi:hypothetical protein